MLTEDLNSDQRLFERILSDDKNAFRILFERYHTILYNRSVNLLKNEDLAHEVVQKTFVQIWNKREEIEIHSNVSGYLFTSTKRFALEIMRRENTRSKHEMLYGEEIFSHDDQGIDQLLLQKHINAAIHSLPDRSKQIFELCKNEGLSHEEAAEYLGLAVKSVSNHMTIAFRKLREYFELHQLKEEIFG